MSIGERITELRAKDSKKSFAEKLEVDQTTIANYENGKRLPNSDFIARLCKLYDVSADWLIYGKVSNPSNQYVSIPTASIELGPDGMLQEDQHKLKKPFLRKWAEKRGNIEDLYLVRAINDSMEPTIKEGNCAMINVGYKKIIPHKIYAIGLDGLVRLFRAYFSEQNLHLECDKYSGKTTVVCESVLNAKQVIILGQALWWEYNEWSLD